MPLSPELHSGLGRPFRSDGLSTGLKNWARIEGVNPDELRREITIFRRERKKPAIQRVLESVDALSLKSVKGFFDSLTHVRTLAPNSVKQFPWEKWYFEEYPEAGNPKKRKTWHELYERNIDERKMYLLYLQDRYVIPEKMLVDLADQATTRDNRQSWLDFNQSVQEVLSEWVDYEWPSSIANGIARGLLSIVPQHPGV